MTRNKTYPMLVGAALLALAVLWKKGGRTTRYTLTVGALLVAALAATYWYLFAAATLALALVWWRRQRRVSRLVAARERLGWGPVRRERMRTQPLPVYRVPARRTREDIPF